MARPKRILHFIPDRPGTGPMINEALRVAGTKFRKSSMGANGKIPLFALRKIEVGVPDGVQIVGVGDTDMRRVSCAATLCSCAMKQNAIEWSLRDDRDTSALLFLSKLAPAGNMASGDNANCGGPSGMDIGTGAPEKESRANLAAMDNAGTSFFGSDWAEFRDEIGEIIKQYSPCNQESALGELLRIISQEIIGPVSGAIQKVKTELLPGIKKKLSRARKKVIGEDEESCKNREWFNGAILRIDRAYGPILELERINTEWRDPFRIADMTAETARVCSELNGFSYACGVAESEFRVAVMNVPWEGEATIGMLRTLFAAGIEVKERGSFGKGISGVRNPTLPPSPPPRNLQSG